MYITRDKLDNEINIWKEKSDFFLDEDGYYQISKTKPIIAVFSKEFKQIFLNQKLPRKGTCKYVELKLYIPGKG